MHQHLNSIYSELKIKYSYQPEYLQAVLEFFESIDVVLHDDPSIEKSHIIRRLVEPDRIISFKVVWEDDHGLSQVNKGYRVQFNQALGPYKGGLRFHPSVNESILKFLGFEQTFKNALTSIPMGGAKGGSDFNPKGKSDQEILRFCRAFMLGLSKYIGSDIDVPAGDIGVSSKELGYMFGFYKQLTNRHNGTLTGKGISYSGSKARSEATGYGLLYMTEIAIKRFYDTSLKNKAVIISGSGNVSLHAAYKAVELGAKVIAMSATDGVIFSSHGLNIKLIEQIKKDKASLVKYKETYSDAVFTSNSKDIWKIKCDLALPCATENELDLDDAKHLKYNGVLAVLEGANMPTTLDATHYLIDNKVLFVPGKAANAGGVAVSGLEMQQNAIHTSWSFEKVDSKLREIMETIFNEIYDASLKYKNKYDLVKGANIASFIRIYQAMLEQGL